MPSQRVYFSITPLNEQSTSASAPKTLNGGVSPKNGNDKVRFAIGSQDRLLPTDEMYLTGQIVHVNSDGTPLAIDAAIDFPEPDDLLKQDAGDILEWLDNKIGLDEISDSAGGAAFDVISELITKYKMSKPEIRKYLQENNILEGDI